MKDGFDYREFTREFKAICSSLENGDESKYDEHLKTTDLLMDEFFNEVFKPALSNKHFCFPVDIDSVAQLFQSIHSVCSSSRERLILSLGEALVYATFGNMLNAETEQGNERRIDKMSEMNELCLMFGRGGYIYYSTRRGAVDMALMELREKLTSIGVNIDNMAPKFAILRDSSDLTIEETSL